MSAVRAGTAASLLAVMLIAGPSAAPASAAVARAAAHGWQSAAVTAPPGAASNPEAQLGEIACTSAADCVAAGYYQNKAGASVPMIATESDGRWARAIRLELPASAAPRATGAAGDVACWAPGSCLAFGAYQDSPTAAAVEFSATEVKGSWGRARTFPLVLPANAGASPDVEFGRLACPGRGSCVAVGSYHDSAGNPLPFVINESNGRWGTAQDIRLPSGARGAVGGQLGGVSCDKVGSCATVGSYFVPSTDKDEGLEVIESNGIWHRGTQVRLPAAVKPSLYNFLTGVSCWAASCMAVGAYETANGNLHTMAVSYSGGRWHRAVSVRVAPRGAARRPLTQLGSVACTATGCTAVGQMFGAGPGFIPVAASESGGRWSRAVLVPLPAGHTTGEEFQGFMNGVACSGSTCTAVGFFLHARFRVLAMASTYR
jgi:hypothetical protein